ncbi:type II toxin-antitoxin system RelE/ParE family toxin [Gardnerella vaginalis]|uniref:type II toxin-antitoxin system RelE/ParE family toxin n=1 Tax=Gardnerella vaginalis TaxID=2702 RepID=UPI0039EDEC15
MRIIETEKFTKWLEKLKNRRAQLAIGSRLFQWKNESMVFGDVKTIHGELKEARFHIDAGYRVYFAQKQDKIVLLVFGGDKSTQDKDIKKADALLKDMKEAGQW